MENTEIWKTCEDAPGVLEVSNLGRVRSLDRESVVSTRTRNGKGQGSFTMRRKGQILSQCMARHGYYEVAVMTDGKRAKHRVHRLVGKAFSPGYFEGASIDHVDGNKANNRADNLEWVTLSENTRRQWEIGLADLRGELAPGAKLSNLQANAVAVLVENDFPVSQVAEWFGVSKTLVYKIAHGRRHLA